MLINMKLYLSLAVVTEFEVSFGSLTVEQC